MRQIVRETGQAKNTVNKVIGGRLREQFGGLLRKRQAHARPPPVLNPLPLTISFTHDVMIRCRLARISGGKAAHRELLVPRYGG